MYAKHKSSMSQLPSALKANRPSSGSLPKLLRKPADLPTVGETVGGFIISEELGKGSFGIVFKAICPLTNSEAALKFPLTIAKNMDSIHEYQIMQKLPQNSKIVLCMQGFYYKGLFVLSMPLMSSDLRTILNEKELFTFSDTTRIIMDILSGLATLASHGLVHHDIKHENILVKMGQNGLFQCKIGDLGLCVPIFEANDREFRGTLVFASPETLLGQSICPRSDIWSLSLLIYECITGYHPLAESVIGKVQYPKYASSVLIKISELTGLPKTYRMGCHYKKYKFDKSLILPIAEAKKDSLLAKLLKVCSRHKVYYTPYGMVVHRALSLTMIPDVCERCDAIVVHKTLRDLLVSLRLPAPPHDI